MDSKDPNFISQDAIVAKSALASKTVHFNLASSVFIPAIWPFLPKSFRDHDYAISALTAWFAIGNIILRFITTEAIKLWVKKT